MHGISSKLRELILPVAVVASLLVILIPVSPGIIDLLLAANITLAVIVLLSTIQVKSPLELSIFPSLLLVATLGRLVLNIATTRLILSNGADSQTAAAGGVIQSFGEYVAGDQLVVGLIIFAIIVLVQFVVITKGATRISEVAARFSLDGLAGKQMAIDAELGSGAIDQQEAHRLRAELNQHSEFYGAMDGASKFVRGDAVAGLMITLINIAGGLAIGLSQGMNINDAVATFTMLTIGDGLASQIPALLIAVAAAMLVTRSTQRANLPLQFLNQLMSRPQVLVIAAGFLLVLTFTQLPKLPLLTIGACCAGIAFSISSGQKKIAGASGTPAETKQPEPERLIADCLSLDPVEFELGVDLIRLADPHRGGKLLGMISDLRREFAEDLGIILPKVRVRDNLELDRNAFRIRIQQLPVATGTVFPERVLATPESSATGLPHGIEDQDPITRKRSVWVSDSEIDAAVDNGMQLSTAAEILVGHLKQAVNDSASKLLTREATSHLLHQLRSTQPSVVEELVPDLLKVGQVQNILQNLLDEGVSIRQFRLILETLADHARATTDIEALTERVRLHLAPYICQRISKGKPLPVIRLEPSTCELLKNELQVANLGDQGSIADWDENTSDKIRAGILEHAGQSGVKVLVVDSSLRRRIRRLVARHMPELAVLSEDEIVPELELVETGQLKVAA